MMSSLHQTTFYNNQHYYLKMLEKVYFNQQTNKKFKGTKHQSTNAVNQQSTKQAF